MLYNVVGCRLDGCQKETTNKDLGQRARGESQWLTSNRNCPANGSPMAHPKKRLTMSAYAYAYTCVNYKHVKEQYHIMSANSEGKTLKTIALLL